ncbi:predicted protein [Nematostella vectensis]|uniref:Fructose-2,6-bisphosphatase TIGAR n=2 Tax=Nematostella vectensis TaxID=45351 RepID=A7S100_NEMVE|nr:predicted protein [Nematostella vectensis]|eukprot:XP_001634734.1 predicted protein [Nematostella vectensis]
MPRHRNKSTKPTRSERANMISFSLWVVRHGETMENRLNIYQGHSDTVLSDKGIQQAKLVAKRLQDEKFNYIFSSDLQRAYKTAEYILEVNKYKDGLAVTRDPRIKEKGYGIMEGKTKAEIHDFLKTFGNSHSFVPEGGESIEQLYTRTVAFVNELCGKIVHLQKKKRKCVDATHRDEAKDEHMTSACSEEDSYKKEKATHVISTCSEMDNGWEGEFTHVMSTCSTEDSHEGENVTHVISSAGGFQKNVGSRNNDIEGSKSRNVYNHPQNDGKQSHLGACAYGKETFNSAANLGNPRAPADLTLSKPVSNVLMVVHGGTIRQLVQHFKRRVPSSEFVGPTKNKLGRSVSPNTGVSRFEVWVDEASAQISFVRCTMLFDASHLEGDVDEVDIDRAL